MNDAAKAEATELVASGAGLDVVSRAEYDIQIATAHKYPRSVKAFRDRALQLATLSETIAQECNYALPRKDKNGQVKMIEGASIRFAEIIGSSWGNAHVGTRVIADDGEFITAQAVFHDLEANWKIVEEVQRRVTDSKGRRYSSDMIGVTANAARSIAMRNAVLHGVPKALWEDIRLRARTVAAGDQRSIASKRLEAVKAFAPYGVTEAQILATLERPGMDDVTIDDLGTLFGILTSIKDGEVTPEEAFAERVPDVDMPRAKETPAQAAQRDAGAALKPTVDGVRERPAATVAAPAVDRATGEIATPTPGNTAADVAAGRVAQPIGPTGVSAQFELGADAGKAAVDQKIADDPMALKRIASKAQRDMIEAIASKHCGLTPEQLDQILVEKFAVTLATLPMVMVNEALQYVRTVKA